MMLAFSLVLALTNAPETALPAMLSGGREALSLAFTLFAVYMVWLSALNIMEKTELNKKLEHLARPLTRRLFPGESEEAHRSIAVNLSANMLGMGGAATPAGIKAMSLMTQKGATRASKNMRLLLVMNATSVQLLPVTVIAMRASAGSANAGDIILPALAATAVSTAVGIIICKLLPR